MGVEGLYKFINVNCPYVYKNVCIKNIKKKSCVIDGIQHIYSQLIYMRTKNKEVYTNDGKNISHIHGLINSLSYYLKNKIIPIFVFDGKSPEIKKKKIEERRNILKNNLKKLRELESAKNDALSDYIKRRNSDDKSGCEGINSDEFTKYFFGTPPETMINDKKINISTEGTFGTEEGSGDDGTDGTFDDDTEGTFGVEGTFGGEEFALKMDDINNEYHKIYKKSIILKDYYIKDWIEILELLGLPVIQAENEADPICSYLLKKNRNIYGIISDDSDMLIFGAPRLMRKMVNQQFKVIELDLLIDTIKYDLLKLNNDLHYNKIDFTLDDLINFCILLGTDYGNLPLKIKYDNSLELLKYYYTINKDILQIINEEDLTKFNEIKDYYINNNNECISKINTNLLNSKPEWNKPKLMELKKRLLELNVDEDYIDETNLNFDECYSHYNSSKYYVYKNKYSSYYSNQPQPYNQHLPYNNHHLPYNHHIQYNQQPYNPNHEPKIYNDHYMIHGINNVNRIISNSAGASKDTHEFKRTFPINIVSTTNNYKS
jgi:5'-3' exonuclease